MNPNLPFLHEAYSNVKEFWTLFRLPIVKAWIDSTKAGRDLSAALMKEEFDELLNATTLVEKLDAYCDLLYVSLGGMMALGYPPGLLAINSPLNYTGPLAESTKLLVEPGIVCHRRLQVCLPEAILGMTDVAAREFKKFPEAFKAVHAANLSKLWPNKSLATDHDSTNVGPGRWLVKRRADGKVVKSPAFTHPDLSVYL